MRAFLIGASPDAPLEHTREVLRILKADAASDLFIGVDGGVKSWLEAGYKPHLAIGDWDSFKGPGAKRVLKSINHITLPRSKDRGDLYFAASTVIQAGATELIVLGATGGRPDHHLAGLLDLGRIAEGFEGVVASIAAYGVEGEYHFVSSKTAPWKKSIQQKRLVSVFALGGAASGVTLSGFEYSLSRAKLEPGSHGLSNRVRSKSCHVAVKAGCLLVLLPA